jgi:hypothetical protein
VYPRIEKSDLLTRLAKIENSARRLLVIEGKRRFGSFTARKLDSKFSNSDCISPIT